MKDQIAVDLEFPKTSVSFELDVHNHRTTKRKQESITCDITFNELGSYNKNTTTKLARCNIVLWRKPFLTLNYFSKQINFLLKQYYIRYWCFNQRLQNGLYAGVFLFTVLSFFIFSFNGPHQLIIKKLSWCFHWIFLGILSSVGLGTGLHTFVLYLAPHVATVTIAAYECRSLNFPEPPYPKNVLCPDSTSFEDNSIGIWNIMRKVQLESFCWGAGTALGELPPYFLARTARLSSGNISSNDESCTGVRPNGINDKNKGFNLINYAKYFVEMFVKKVGFFGILTFASVPNPLFDLAGITCGHFLVPFWKFFGATLIGKAIIKVSLQVIFVIILSSEKLLKTFMELMEVVPTIGVHLKKVVDNLLSDKKQRFYKKAFAFENNSHRVSILSSFFEIITIAMIIYFVVSIINSFAQAYYDRTQSKLKSFKV